MGQRCLLAQAAHWWLDGTEPISDDAFVAAPVDVDENNPELRNLFLTLFGNDCHLRGELTLELFKGLKWKYPDEEYRLVHLSDDIYEEEDSTPPVREKADEPIDICRFQRWRVRFSHSILSANNLYPEYDHSWEPKWASKYPRQEGWQKEKYLSDVTLDFDKLRRAKNGLKTNPRPETSFEELTPWLTFMYNAAIDLELEPGKYVSKGDIQSYLKKNWPRSLGNYSAKMGDPMATFLRHPDERTGHAAPKGDTQ